MSGYTSGNKAPTLERQHAVKAGNVNGAKPSHKGGATDQPKHKGSTAYGAGHVAGASAGGKDVTSGRGQKVTVHHAKGDYETRKSQAYMAGGDKFERK
jgi:hypothetical protein